MLYTTKFVIGQKVFRFDKSSFCALFNDYINGLNGVTNDTLLDNIKKLIKPFEISSIQISIDGVAYESTNSNGFFIDEKKVFGTFQEALIAGFKYFSELITEECNDLEKKKIYVTTLATVFEVMN